MSVLTIRGNVNAKIIANCANANVKTIVNRHCVYGCENDCGLCERKREVIGNCANVNTKIISCLKWTINGKNVKMLRISFIHELYLFFFFYFFYEKTLDHTTDTDTL